MVVDDISAICSSTSNPMKDVTIEHSKTNSSEVYIEFLSRSLGASREEILQVVKHSGISTRRIAEYLLKQKSSSASMSPDDE